MLIYGVIYDLVMDLVISEGILLNRKKLKLNKTYKCIIICREN